MKKILPKMRKAFTMVELVFVLVVLGIVASIGAEIIAQIYESYIVQRAQQKASVKTELAATQIANRLAYAIPGTAVRRIEISGTAESIIDPLGGNADDYNVLQWVGYDADSFGAHDGVTAGLTRSPGWSGFCDLNASTGTALSTPGSNLALANTIIGNLSDGTKSITDAVVYFTGYENNETNISTATGSTITLASTPDKKVEHYKLAWTSYTLEVDANDDLWIHYNFDPSPAAAITGTTSQILLRNVTTFKFRGDGKTIRFKICKSENIGEDFNITACKEKAVF